LPVLISLLAITSDHVPELTHSGFALRAARGAALGKNALLLGPTTVDERLVRTCMPFRLPLFCDQFTSTFASCKTRWFAQASLRPGGDYVMQEINNARQESSAQCSGQKEHRCRVCDGAVEWPHIVCRECWYRDQKEQEWDWELYCMETDEASAKAVMGGYDRKASRESPKLIVLCGPSHVGETAFARRLRNDFAVISPDKIRERLSVDFGDSKCESRVWDIYESMKQKALERGRNVILDACHMSKRARWHSLQGPNARHRKICIVFDLRFRTIRERCLKEKRVSLGEVERMWRDFQNNKPSAEELRREGFGEVYFIRERPGHIMRLVSHGFIAVNLITGRETIPVRVVPIRREEADKLDGKFVRLPDGTFTPAVFRQHPEGKEVETTGLQYWFRYDLLFAKFKSYEICGGKKVKICPK